MNFNLSTKSQRASSPHVKTNMVSSILRYLVRFSGPNLLNDLPYGVVQIIEWITLLVKVKINSHASVRVVS